MFDDLRRKYKAKALLLYAFVVAVWFVVTMLPFSWAFVDSLNSPTGETHYGVTGLLFWLFAVGVGAMGVLSILIMRRFDHRIVPFLINARRPATDERSATESVETLSLATGERPPTVLIVEHEGINVGVAGRGKRRVVMVTTGALARNKADIDSLIAIALARQAIGGVACGRLQLMMMSPVACLVAYLKWVFTNFAKAVKLFACVPVVWLVLFTPVLVTRDVGAWLHSALMWGFVLVFVSIVVSIVGLPSWSVGWLALVAFTMLIAREISMPAAIDSDIGAVGLTRYPDPLMNLLREAKTLGTQPGSYSVATSSIWVLPYGAKQQAQLDQRISAMQRFMARAG